jgi:hypothetical protein
MRIELLENIDRVKLKDLLASFKRSTKRMIDRGLADEIETQILDCTQPNMTIKTMRKLARWCKTNGSPYQDGMPVAQQISRLLFGIILDRTVLNT